MTKTFFAGMEWNPSSLQRSVQGILSVLLSLKKNPIIRYQQFSPLARRLAESIRVGEIFSPFFCSLVITVNSYYLLL
jgi:hypothetical protein